LPTLKINYEEKATLLQPFLQIQYNHLTGGIR
jgi:hypothetical protein